MDTDAENIEMKAQIAQLREDVADLRASGLRGSKTEALFAMQYDSLPDFYKSPKTIAIYKKIQTALWFIIPIVFLAFALKIGSLVWRDHESQVWREQQYASHGFHDPKETP